MEPVSSPRDAICHCPPSPKSCNLPNSHRPPHIPRTRRSDHMKTAIVIPARFASSRLPGKPLLKETGKYLIQHVYEQAAGGNAERVIVATDDQRILDAVRGFGGEAVMTRAD